MTSAVLPLGPLERAFVASLQRLEPQTPEAVLLAERQSAGRGRRGRRGPRR